MSTKGDKKALIKQQFDALDVDGSGALNAEELQKLFALNNITKTPKEIGTLIRGLDNDGSGTLDFDEFLAIFNKQPKDPAADDKILRECFNRFDVDKNGSLSKDEFKNIMMEMGQDPLKEEDFNYLMDCVDTDHNGQISIDEYMNFVKGNVDF